MSVAQALLIAEAAAERLEATPDDLTPEECALLRLAEAVKQYRADKLNLSLFEE